MAVPPAAENDPAPASEPAATETGGTLVTPEPFAEPTEPAPAEDVVADIEERTLSGGVLRIGSESAPVAMDVFLNPQSPYSREFQASRMPRVLSAFVVTGKLAVNVYVLPIAKYEGSAFAARAVSCAAAQGRGYPAFDLLVREGRTELAAADQETLGLDAPAYVSCIQTGTDDPFAASSRAVEQWGVTLVPTYVIHDRKYEGLPTEADLLGQIREFVR